MRDAKDYKVFKVFKVMKVFKVAKVENPRACSFNISIRKVVVLCTLLSVLYKSTLPLAHNTLTQKFVNILHTFIIRK